MKIHLQRETDPLSSAAPLAKNLTVDIGICFKLNTDIQVQFGRTHRLDLGLKRLVLEGTLRCAVDPILRDMRALARVDFCLLGSPLLDFEFDGFLRFLNAEPLHWMVLKIVKELACRMIVYPYTIQIPIHQRNEVMESSISLSEPLGVMRIEIVEGRNLRAAGINQVDAKSRMTWGCIHSANPCVVFRYALLLNCLHIFILTDVLRS